MLKVVAVVVAIVGGVLADDVKFKDCGSVSGTIDSVDITSCASEPCQFFRGKNVNVTVDFTANAAISSATTKVYGYILGIKVPFPVPDDACQDMTCPIAKSSAVTYRNSVSVLPQYPEVSVVVQWEIHDQDDKFIVCFNVPVQITS